MVEKTEKVFRPQTHLESAESMLLEIEADEISKDEKYENLIHIAQQIANACGNELDSNNPVYEKYAMLHCHIPISMFTYMYSPLYAPLLKEVEQKVSTAELRMAMIWLASSEAKTNLVKKVYFEYIFNLVYISLKEIFKEVKKEIMGE